MCLFSFLFRLFVLSVVVFVRVFVFVFVSFVCLLLLLFCFQSFVFIQFNVPLKIISLIETSQSIDRAKREYPGKTT